MVPGRRSASRDGGPVRGSPRPSPPTPTTTSTATLMKRRSPGAQVRAATGSVGGDVDRPGLHPGDTVSLLSASCIRFRVGVEEQSGGGLTGTLHTAFVFNHLILCCIAATQPPDIQPAAAAAPPPSPPLNTSSSSNENLQAADDSVGKDKSKKGVFRKLFTKK